MDGWRIAHGKLWVKLIWKKNYFNIFVYDSSPIQESLLLHDSIKYFICIIIWNIYIQNTVMIYNAWFKVEIDMILYSTLEWLKLYLIKLL